MSFILILYEKVWGLLN